MNLTNHQSEQLQLATSGNVGLLTGNPGSGKTTTIAAYIRALTEANGNGGIAVAAPTGKAACRITESLCSHGLDITATTIHRLLGFAYSEGHGVFSHDRNNPLPYSFVFVDESSMIDASLMSSLISARQKNGKMIFIGDPNQLPPVGHGAPLRDMIAMRLPHGHLSEIHRNAGRVVRCCKSIVEDQRWESSRQLDIPAGENLYVDSDWRNAEQQIGALKNWLLPDSQLFEIEGINDPIWDVQIIVPINKKSEVSRVALNKVLQGLLNPDGEQVAGNPFRVGDKIVCGKNGWYLSAPGCPADVQSEEGKVYCANGEQGRVIQVQPKSTIVELSLPHRIVRASKPTGDEESSRWDLAYAITCHKSQGAEWPAVIVIGDDGGGAKRLCDRHWLLTAISRQQTACVCIAKIPTLRDMCKKSNLWKRKTFSVDKYFELLGGI